MIKRFYNIENLIEKNKVLVIYGPRQVGKTTLLKSFLEKTLLKYKFDTGNNINVQNILSSQNFDIILPYIKEYQLYVIDEAQREAKICDLLIVIGSSLVVYPAANLPYEAKLSGAKLVIINIDPTPLDSVADLVIHNPAGEVFPQAVGYEGSK